MADSVNVAVSHWQQHGAPFGLNEPLFRTWGVPAPHAEVCTELHNYIWVLRQSARQILKYSAAWHYIRCGVGHLQGASRLRDATGVHKRADIPLTAPVPEPSILDARGHKSCDGYASPDLNLEQDIWLLQQAKTLGHNESYIKQLLMTSRHFIVDDADSQINYSSSWYRGGCSSEYQNTTHATKAQGAFFTFNFVGTSVKVYGTLTHRKLGDDNDRPTFPNTTYVLDDRSPVLFLGRPPSTSDAYQQLFYSSPPLPYANHTLVGTCVDEGSLVWIDYLVVEIPFQVDFTVNLAHSEPTPNFAGVIVPAVLGALLLLASTLALYFWCRLYRHAAQIQLPRPLDVPQAQPPGNFDVLYCAESHKSALPQLLTTS
ncbi:hypothetical protein AB1N83_012424 [Pleurotus pulmonarius]